MLRTLFAVTLLAAPCFAQTSVDLGQFRREAASFQAAINEVAATVIPGFGLLQETRGTYLEGYGAVFTLEVALDRPRNPFSTASSPAEVRQNVSRRQKEVKDRIVELLKLKALDLKSLTSSDSIAIVIHLMNTNPADMPNLPAQILVKAKKQDLADFKAGKLAANEIDARIRVKEF